MTQALQFLQQAEAQLEQGSRNKGGHRQRALDLVKQAIAETQQGIRTETPGLQFYKLGGDFVLSRLASALAQPDVATDGTIYSVYTENLLGAWNPVGDRLHTFTLGNGINTVLTSPDVGADGTIYIGENFPDQVVALRTDGSQKWKLAAVTSPYARSPRNRLVPGCVAFAEQVVDFSTD